MANNLDTFIPEIWSTRIVEKLYQTNIALALCANTDYEGEIKAAGDTVQVRTYGRVTLSPYVRGQELDFQALTPTKEAMVINDAHAFAFEVDDLDAAQNDLNAILGYTNEAGMAMNELVDTKVFGYTTSALAANQISNSGSALDITASAAGSTHVYDILVLAAKNLDEQNAPQEGRWVVVSPYFRSLLMKDTVYFIKGSALGDKLLATGRPGATARTAPGFIGQIAGFDVYCSNNLKTNGNNRYCPYGQGRPISYAAQIRKLKAFDRENTFASAVKGLLLHDGAVFAEHAKKLGYVYVDNS